MRNMFFVLFLMISIKTMHSQHAIIPQPVSYESGESAFVLKDKLKFHIETKDAQSNKYIDIFKDFIEKAGIATADSKKSKKNTISISLNKEEDKELGKEGYQLEVNKNNIRLVANQSAGVFNGLQTLQQLLPAEFANTTGYESKSVSIQGCKIKDYPRFGWRGLLLDVSRHFYTVDEVKSYIDRMAQYKFNVFHWHLTDDQGWRIEIKAYPKLTEVGAWRVERYGRLGPDRKKPQVEEKATYGGFYTQEEIKDVVQYALNRNITILPEIDFPGHSMAVLAAYPELSTLKEPVLVNAGNKFVNWSPFEVLEENTLNPADDKVYEFLDNVFTEVADLFPGAYIHIGGDEAYHGFWKRDASVQQFMKENNIPNEEVLQSYFIKRLEKIIASKNKKMIGWGEIMIGGLAEDATVMSWKNMKAGIEASKLGNDVIMTPRPYTYLDLRQGDESVETKFNKFVSLEKSYKFDPLPKGVVAKHVLGGQGSLWTEQVPNLPYAFYMSYPRAFALSEALWTPKDQKDWKGFVERTEVHFKRFDATNTNVSKAIYDPIVRIYKEGDKLMCALRNVVENVEIFYTIDNTYPVQFGEKYTAPFEIPAGDLSLRTQNFRNGKPLGRVLLIHRKELEKRVKK